jgi:hypothetical protein
MDFGAEAASVLDAERISGEVNHRMRARDGLVGQYPSGVWITADRPGIWPSEIV